LGLSLDTANPDAELLEGVVRLSDKVPGLRIVVDHPPNAFARVKGDLGVLDALWGLFGEDRLLFGSDWPN
jgi:L-fuconolactonase